MTPVGAVDVLECVVNVSEGRDRDRLARLAASAGAVLLDVHVDVDHNRSVFTLGGPGPDVEEASRTLASAVVDAVDIGAHHGVHPRLGALDVVPWVHLEAGPDRRLRDGSIGVAVAARDRFCRWAAAELDLPSFVYGPGAGEGGPEPTLPQLRREAWHRLRPSFGPDRPHPTAGTVCVGARAVLVAYNLWLADGDEALARRIAGEIRSPTLRTLGLRTGDGVQVSCNLVAPWRTGPAAAFDAVAARASVERAELVGLLPRALLDAVPDTRWEALGLGPTTTIEARLGETGLDGGRFIC